MTERRYPPNRQLAWARLQRGWSYEELAARIRAAMKDDPHEGESGLSANTVRRWETGERWPDPRFRKHLVAILQLPASDLGLLTTEELAMRPDSDVESKIKRILAMADAGEVNRMKRSDFLRGILGLASLPLVTGLVGDDSYEILSSTAESRRPCDAGTTAAFTRIVAAQRDLYWTSPPNDLFESAYAHARLGVRLLRSTQRREHRTVLAIALAESAMLAGRLAFFDMRRPATAERCYEVALDASREAGDHAFAAAVLGHMAFIPAFAGDVRGGLDLVDAAQQHCWHGVSPVVRSWLHCVAAESVARSAEPKGYQRRIGLAEEAVATTELAPAWFDFYDASRLDGFAGYCALAAGDTSTAQHRLAAALRELAPTGGKQGTVLLADLATAHLDDAAHAAALVDQALSALDSGWYATGQQRIGEVIDQLPDGIDRSQVEERYRAIAHAPMLSGW